MKIEQFKTAVIQKCTDILELRISDLERELKLLFQDIAEDTKSSAGDKFETSREMANIEREKLAGQLEIARKSLINLNATPSKREEIKGGALIKTDKAWIFLSVSLGPVKVEGEDVLVITPLSPLGSSFMDKRIKETVVFNNQQYRIEAIA